MQSQSIGTRVLAWTIQIVLAKCDAAFLHRWYSNLSSKLIDWSSQYLQLLLRISAKVASPPSTKRKPVCSHVSAYIRFVIRSGPPVKKKVFFCFAWCRSVTDYQKGTGEFEKQKEKKMNDVVAD